MLSKGNSGWVLYDDEGRIAELAADRDAMLEAAMRNRWCGSRSCASLPCVHPHRHVYPAQETNIAQRERHHSVDPLPAVFIG